MLQFWPMKLRRIVAAAVLIGFAGRAAALCGGGLDENNFHRPIDYNDPEERDNIRLVERFHFTHEIESLQAGKNGPLPGDIEYTLRHIPNHYRALHAMAEWQRQNPTPPRGLQYLKAECYFERAFAFKPEDATIYLVYGVFLHKNGDLESARTVYERGLELKPDHAELIYNFGLLLVDLKQYDEARRYADRAYELGYPLPGLRNKLARAGQ